MKFKNYGFSKEIKKNLEKMGFVRPTDIQYKSIPAILEGGDILAVAQTGTGKTVAFALPVIDMINKIKSNKQSYGIKALVMVPTRELAMQNGKVFAKLSKNTKVKTFSVYGGVEQEPQIKALLKGVDIVIATPGRMFDLIHQGYLKTDNISIVILDEADRMLKLGFFKDIEDIQKKIKHKHQTLFFSATIDKEIKKKAYKLINSKAIRIEISPKDPVSKNVTHYVSFIKKDDKRAFLKNLLENQEGAKTIIFVRTIIRAERLLKTLNNFGFTAQTIHRNKKQEERTQILKNFKNNNFKILIATDILARGIDIEDIELVVNYDLPEIAENYVHRVGRTGRGKRRGTAITFCSEEEKPVLKEIENFLNKKIEEIKIGKKQYKEIVKISTPPKTIEELKKLVEEESMFKRKKKKKKK